MNKNELYIYDKLIEAKITKLLILYEPNQVLEILLQNYSLDSIIYSTNKYLDHANNLFFLGYFNEIKDKLERLIHILIFESKKNNIDADEIDYDIYENVLNDLFDSLNVLRRIPLSNKEEYKKVLMSFRSLKKFPDVDMYLKCCYLMDENIINLLNSEDDSILLNKQNYLVVFGCLSYYYHNVKIVNDKILAKQRIKQILFYNYPDLSYERLHLYYLMLKNFEKNLEDLELDDDIENEQVKIKSKKNNILYLNNYKKDE